MPQPYLWPHLKTIELLSLGEFGEITPITNPFRGWILILNSPLQICSGHWCPASQRPKDDSWGPYTALRSSLQWNSRQRERQRGAALLKRSEVQVTYFDCLDNLWDMIRHRVIVFVWCFFFVEFQSFDFSNSNSGGVAFCSWKIPSPTPSIWGTLQQPYLYPFQASHFQILMVTSHFSSSNNLRVWQVERQLSISSLWRLNTFWDDTEMTLKWSCFWRPVALMCKLTWVSEFQAAFCFTTRIAYRKDNHIAYTTVCSLHWFRSWRFQQWWDTGSFFWAAHHENPSKSCGSNIFWGFHASILEISRTNTKFFRWIGCLFADPTTAWPGLGELLVLRWGYIFHRKRRKQLSLRLGPPGLKAREKLLQ